MELIDAWAVEKAPLYLRNSHSNTAKQAETEPFELFASATRTATIHRYRMYCWSYPIVDEEIALAYISVPVAGCPLDLPLVIFQTGVTRPPESLMTLRWVL